MIERAHVIGAGRVGSAIAARLRERGLDLAAAEPELVLLCV
ncbi:MAG: prephenate dehydrogenase, partial [Actinobacteria bacterium]|nr:prephenate dehydrogenase [Actinomycetota bacterium]